MGESKLYPVIGPDGKVSNVKGQTIDFSVEKELWSEYLLSDGTKLKVKNVLISVVKTEGTDQFGNPVYILKGQQVVDVADK